MKTQKEFRQVNKSTDDAIKQVGNYKLLKLMVFIVMLSGTTLFSSCFVYGHHHGHDHDGDRMEHHDNDHH